MKIMINTVYGIVKERYMLGEFERESYGIAVLAAYDGEIPCVIDTISDVTDDRERLTVFVDKLNRCELSPVHFYDAVEDFVAEL